MKASGRIDAVRGTVVLTVTILALTFLGACKNHFDEDEKNRQAQTKKGPAQISIENGQTVVALDSPTQNRLGLEVVTLTRAVTRKQLLAPGVVLSAQDLTTSRNSYVAAQAQLQKSRIEAGVAGKEYSRLKTLFEESQNISEKSLQSAEGISQTSEADVHAGEQQLHLQESVIRQEWGNVVARWVVEDSPELQRIFNQREVVVQITIPSTATFGAPKTILLEIPGGARMEATSISPFPRVDPRIQGKSFLYLTPARSGLVAGINLVAHLSTGSPMQGVIVPSSAVVWSEGKAWVYQQTAPDRFTRRVVATDTPVEKGFFVTTGPSVGDKVVTQGAQALLSQELLLHGQQGAEPDVD